MADTAHDGQQYVFISYASADHERVLPIVEALTRAGISIWRDQDSIAGGTSYGPAIASAIRGSRAVLILCSDASLASRNVRQEIAIAWKHERPYVPLLLDPVTTLPEEIEYWLESAQWIEVLDHHEEVWLPRVIAALASLGVVKATNATRSVPASQPAPHAPAPSKSSIPTPLTELIGRQDEVDEVGSLLRVARLVTLIGPGGIGKTRLAIAVAHAAVTTFRDGVVFVPLAAVRDPALVISTIAATLDIREAADEPLLTTLTRALTDRHLLLVLDNLEQVAEEVSEVAALLVGSPHLHVLATSRVPLHVSGEREYSVSPLPTHDSDASVEPRVLADIANTPAVTLFVDRAQAVKRDFHLTADNAAAVVAICRRLDGLPLAIELAAARIRVLSPQAILSRLDRPLGVLIGGTRDLPERQQTIRATIQWSYDLLPPDEQRLFRRLSVFAGGWTLDSAEAVIADGDVGIDVLDGLLSLVEKSLITHREQPDGALRFGMLETIREFARERLDQHDDVAALQRAHAGCFLHRLETIDVYRHDVSKFDVIDVADAEFPNIRAAIHWGLAHDTDLAARLIVCLHDFWLTRGQLREVSALTAVALPGVPQPTYTRARLLNLVATFEHHAAASAAAEEAVGIARSLRDERLLGRTLKNSADVFVNLREAAQASARYTEALAISRACGDHLVMVHSLMGLGGVAFLNGDVDGAVTRYEEAVALARQGREPVVWGFFLLVLGETLALRGEQTRALSLYREVITQPARFADLLYVIRCIEGIAHIVAATDPTSATTLLGAARAARDRIGYETISVVLLVGFEYSPSIDDLRRALGVSAFTDAWERGRRMSLAAALEFALGQTDD